MKNKEHGNIGKTRTEETKLLMSKLKMKKVICIETGKIYESLKELAEEMGIKVPNICRSIKYGEPYKGFHYKKIDEVNYQLLPGFDPSTFNKPSLFKIE